MKANLCIFASATLLLLATTKVAHCQGTVLVQHLGNANPTTEGFILASYGNPQLAPVSNDMGMNAWSIGMTAADAARYIQQLTIEQTLELANADWELSLTLRIIEAPSTPGYDINAALQTGSQRFILYFGAAPNGDPIVQITGSSVSPVFVLEGAGATYNNYRLVYNAAAGAASLWVNGVEQISDIMGGQLTVSQAALGWSAYEHVNDVQVNWNEVTLQLIPEPSAITLIFLGGGVLFTARHRSIRKYALT